MKEIEEPFEKEQIGMVSPCLCNVKRRLLQRPKLTSDHAAAAARPLRFQRHALQEEPNACRALLQFGQTPGGADVRPAADGLGAVAGEDAGRQRQQVSST